VDNWRWQGIPFYLRTGKRLPDKISEVAIQFRSIPHQTFPTAALMDWCPIVEDDDYPDFVAPLAMAVVRQEVVRGIAICGSGVGACVAANKISGVRAALIIGSFSAQQGVADDDMNIICLGAGSSDMPWHWN